MAKIKPVGNQGDDQEEGGGYFNLDMGEFGSGTFSDPLRHAVGMRTAQDQYKMQMWNSFPSLFQNTIFHGEQDQRIKELRHGGTVAERLSWAKELKEEGNSALKASSSNAVARQQAAVEQPEADEGLLHAIQQVEALIAAKEQELRTLRQQLKSLRLEYDAQTSSITEVSHQTAAIEAERANAEAKGLESAITSYEKAAGLLRYVECVRPDWKNDDGSYKGIEDEWLRVDECAIQDDCSDVEEARELVRLPLADSPPSRASKRIDQRCCKRARHELRLDLIAYDALWLQQFDQMQRACDEVLTKVNPYSVKALYRRAQARIASLSALDGDRDAAIQDLLSAAKLAPQDKDVRTLLTKLRTEKRKQETDDRNTFAGMFDRGEVVTNDPREEGDPKQPVDWDLRDPRIQNLLDIRPGPDAYTN